jgi:uncharacterized membrane protein
METTLFIFVATISFWLPIFWCELRGIRRAIEAAKGK